MEKIFPLISDTDYLIFHSLNEGEENLKKWLINHAHNIEYNMSWHVEDWQKYTTLNPEIIKKIL